MGVRLKVLELPNYVTVMDDELPEIKPIFYRDGFYLLRTNDDHAFCWAEWNNRAFLIDEDSFQMDLKVLNHRPLTHRERLAIIELWAINRKLYQPLLDLLMFDDFWQEIREIQRMGRWEMIKFLREYEEA